jgi:hypothetical protein
MEKRNAAVPGVVSYHTIKSFGSIRVFPPTFYVNWNRYTATNSMRVCRPAIDFRSIFQNQWVHDENRTVLKKISFSK